MTPIKARIEKEKPKQFARATPDMSALPDRKRKGEKEPVIPDLRKIK